jgi:hypothetical protein
LEVDLEDGVGVGGAVVALSVCLHKGTASWELGVIVTPGAMRPTKAQVCWGLAEESLLRNLS